MKTAAALLLAASALATAQVTYNETTGIYTCAKPNVAYCAGDSLGTDIIIRCDAAGKGQPGRCSNNLVGQPPIGTFPALCYETSKTAGDAACEKNCVVYAEPSFTLPSDVCKPTYTATSSVPLSTVTTTYVNPPTGTAPTTKSTKTTTYVNPSGSGGPGPQPSNGTLPTTATRTPIGPSGTKTGPSTVPTAGAAANGVTGVLAIAGLAAAYFL